MQKQAKGRPLGDGAILVRDEEKIALSGLFSVLTEYTTQMKLLFLSKICSLCLVSMHLKLSRQVCVKFLQKRVL